jgi:hypothetical protein
MLIKILENTISKFPYSIEELHKEYPGVSFPKNISDETLASFGVFQVVPSILPTIDTNTHKIVTTVENVEGIWTQVYVVEELELAKAERNVRRKRNILLKETDWTALSDVVMSTPMAEYRQALRDITSQEGFPYSVIWPTPPEH